MSSQTTFTPGFYKIFDEILVNAADNKVSAATLKVEERTDGLHARARSATRR